MKKLIIIIFVSLLAINSFGYDIEGSRQSGMAGTLILSSPSANALLNCPTGSLFPKQFVIESTGNRKYDMAELDEAALMVAYRFKNLTASLGFSRFGTPDYYTEKVFQATFGYHINSFTAILLTSGRFINIGGEYGGKFGAGSIGLGGSYKIDNFHFGLTFDDLNKPKIANGLEGENIKLNLFAEIDGGEKHSFTGRLILEKYEKPLMSLGQFINLKDQNGLFWGLSLNPLKYGGGFEVEYSGFRLTYGVSHHPTLGFSHYVSLSYLAEALSKSK